MKDKQFIQSALREWVYGWTYQNSAERAHALASWQHHYNWHRPHSGIGHIAPVSGLKSANNLLTVHSQATAHRLIHHEARSYLVQTMRQRLGLHRLDHMPHDLARGAAISVGRNWKYPAPPN